MSTSLWEGIEKYIAYWRDDKNVTDVDTPVQVKTPMMNSSRGESPVRVTNKLGEQPISTDLLLEDIQHQDADLKTADTNIQEHATMSDRNEPIQGDASGTNEVFVLRDESSMRDLKMRYIVGKLAGTDLLSRSGQMILKKNDVITVEGVQVAEREGKLVELIMNMVIDGFGD